MNEVAITLNILGTLMEDIIVGNLNGTSIVTADTFYERTLKG